VEKVIFYFKPNYTINKKNDTTMTKGPKKDYTYRSTWKHKFSRARNLEQRAGLTKKEMVKKYGRFPRKNEWWGKDGSYKEWKTKWVLENPLY
jgi:hypothetical protein|tara:strand:- start:204 stop:479 length:276 start_codon:yes stop_codon:yes gene_type:complete